MKGRRRYYGSLISSVYGIYQRLARAPKGFRILMYHAVGSKVPGDIYGLYNISPELFKEQMRNVSGSALKEVTRLHEMTGQGLAITFDDGFRDNLEVAAPVLAELGLPFTVFVTPHFVLSGQLHYLSVAGLRELAAVPGASIGAHGYSHCRLTECDNGQLQEELVRSRQWLEDAIGRSVTTMSYPHGAVDQRVRKAAAAAGYSLAAGSRSGSNLSGYDPFCLARTAIWAQDDLRVFQSKLAGDWDWLKWR